jgi:hypothetical protein
LTDFADEKVSFFDAAILIFSPLAGLRPSRSGVALTLNLPNPGSETSCRVHDVFQDVLDDGLGVRFAYAMSLSDLCDKFVGVHCKSRRFDSGRPWHGPGAMSLLRHS